MAHWLTVSGGERYARREDVRLSQGAFTATLPASSVHTFEVEGVTDQAGTARHPGDQTVRSGGSRR